MAKNKAGNVTVFRKKWNINIGVIIFGIVFVYLAATVLLYLTGKHISAYEVREGSILKDNAYTGFIVREEAVVTSEADGYVNYFAPEGSKAGAKTYVYSISSEELDFMDASAEEAEELSAEETEALLVKAQDFTDHFHAGQFNDTYVLKDNIAAVLENKSSQSRQEQLAGMLSSGNEGINAYCAQVPGVVVYSTDGYEDITVNDVTEEMLTKQNYESVILKNNSKVKKGSPVYKVITDDTWTIVIQIDDDTAQELSDTERIRVQFSKDHEISTADFEIRSVKGAKLGFLTFDSSMVRYAGERYLDIELILNDESGLKIPRSSVVKKEFYVVPDSYLTQGGNSSETGVLVKGSADKAEFKKVQVYYRDNNTAMVYLDKNVFEKNTLLVKTDSDDTYMLKETKSLEGVYNINRGYAIFREIKILCESEEYYIVESGSDYGLTNYDHIALNGEDVRENDVVF